MSDQIISKEDGKNEDIFALEKPWWKYSYLRKNHLIVFVLSIATTVGGYDGSIMNGFIALETWNKAMGFPQGQRLGQLYVSAIYGGLVCVLFSPYLADKFGRRFCLIIASLLAIVGGIVQGVSNTYWVFFVSRLILGLSSGVGGGSGLALISELSYPTYRAYTTAFNSFGWSLGAVIAAWVTYGTRNIESNYAWKIPSYLQALLPFLQFVGLLFCPESPRYLVSKGRVEEAEAILADLHTGNSTDERSRQIVAFEIEEIQSAIEMEQVTRTTSYKDFLFKPAFRKRLFLLIFTGVMQQFSGNALVSYYLSKVLYTIGITTVSKQLQINGALMAYSMVIGLAVASVYGRFKRRTIFLTGICGMMLAYIVWTALSAVSLQKDFAIKSYSNGVLGMIFIYYLFYNIAFAGVNTYMTEILPYSHRAKGLNIYGFSQTMVTIFNFYTNPIALENIGWKYYIVYCCWLAVEFIMVFFFYVETSGYTLEEVAKVFGDEAPVARAHLKTPEFKSEAEHVDSRNSKEKYLDINVEEV